MTGLAFRPDGSLLYSASTDKTLAVWDCATWKELARHPFRDRLDGVAVSPNGKWVATISPLQRIGASELTGATDQVQRSEVAGSFGKVCFSPDGRMLFVDKERRPGFIFREQGLLRFHSLSPLSNLDHDRGASSIEVGANGALLVSASNDRSVKLSEVGSGRLLTSLTVSRGGNLYAALSPDGKLLVVTDDHRMVLYEVTGLQEQTLVGYHELPIQSMAFAPDGQALSCLAKQRDVYYCEITTWPLEGSIPRRSLYFEGYMQGVDRRLPVVTYHPDGTLLASSPEWTKDIWHSDDTKQWRQLPDRWLLANYFCFARDGQTLWGATADTNEVISLNWPKLTPRSTWTNGPDIVINPIHSLRCVTAANRWVLAGSRDQTTKLLRVSDGLLQHFWRSPGGPVHSVALNASETLAASGTQQGIVQVVRLPEGETVQEWQAHRSGVESVAFSPDGQLLATGSRDRTVRLWQRDGDAWNELLTLSFGAPVRQICFNPDGKKLAVLVQNERAVRL